MAAFTMDMDLSPAYISQSLTDGSPLGIVVT